MSTFHRVEVSPEQAAQLLRVQPETIRRRLRAGELSTALVQGRRLVVLDPGHTWVRVEDAAAMLGLTSGTVRGAIRRGELAGKREEGGRYRVRLASVLADRRCDATIVSQFGGPEAPPELPAPPATAHRLRRDVHVMLDQEELELLERAQAVHGSFRAAFVAGLRAIDLDGPAPEEIAELRVAHDVYRDQAERANTALRQVSQRLRERPVDELACVACERLVSIDEAEFERLEDGSVVIVHAQHGRDRRGRPRKGSVLALQHLPEPAA